MKDSFIFYTAYAEKFKRLSDLQFGQFVRALVSYQITGEEPEIKDASVGMAFDVAKVEVDAANEKYIEICEQRREAGLRGGRPKKANGFSEEPKKANGFDTKAKKTNGFSENQTKANESKKSYNDNDNDNDNDNNIIKNIDHRSGDHTDDPPEVVTLLEKRFEEFWNLYPRKVGKLKAFQSFKRINPNKELFDNMMEALRENIASNAQWKRDNGQYIPHPTTWLNQGRWFDEISTDAPGAGEDFFTRALKGEVDY